MTEHSIDELKRQMDDALSRLRKAQLDATFAEKRYHDARVKATGLLNKVVKGSKHSVLVQDVEFVYGKPWKVRGFRIKADGTPGFSVGKIYLDRSHEVLPYEAVETRA